MDANSTALETIFSNSGVGTVSRTPFNEQADPDSYEGRVKAAIDDAVDYEESYLSRAREENQRYYNGLEPSLTQPEEGEEEEPIGRSTFVSTDVRDTILAVMPSLIRIFTTNDQRIAEFVPRQESDEPMAEQAFDYINYVFFNDNPGYLVLHGVFKDALTVKAGITKWWTDNDYEVVEHEFQNLTQEQYQYLVYEMPDVEVVDQGEVDPNTGLISTVTFRHMKNTPITKIDGVPPEEFRISKNAKTIETASLVGHERTVTKSELVAKGYDLDEIADMVSSEVSYSEERYLRNEGLSDDRYYEGIRYGEWYIRIDGDGDGVDELRYICTIGDNYTIVSDEIVPYSRFALWSTDPRAHTAIGDCLADITKDIQRIKTNMMRGQLDNLAESINPRSVVNELVTNIEDVLNDEVGAVIRTRGDPNSAVAFTKTPYAGDQVQVTIDYLDKVRASRTGITEASKGLDPRAMQSTTLVGIDAIISGAQERIELIARNLAETGLRAMFTGLLREITDHPNQLRTVKLRGKWTDVNPSLFDPSMRLQVNPTLGKGTDQIRLQALMKVEQTQMMVMDKFGINNPVVTPTEFLNTQEDILSLANIKNTSRYFKRIDPATMDQIMNAPKEPTPELVVAQAQMEDVKRKTIEAGNKQQNDQARAMLENKKIEQKSIKDKMDDDFRRDKLNVDAALEAAALMQTDITEPAGLSELNQPNE